MCVCVRVCAGIPFTKVVSEPRFKTWFLQFLFVSSSSSSSPSPSPSSSSSSSKLLSLSSWLTTWGGWVNTYDPCGNTFIGYVMYFYWTLLCWCEHQGTGVKCLPIRGHWYIPPMAVSMRKHDDEAVRGFYLEVRYIMVYHIVSERNSFHRWYRLFW